MLHKTAQSFSLRGCGFIFELINLQIISSLKTQVASFFVLLIVKK